MPMRLFGRGGFLDFLYSQIFVTPSLDPSTTFAGQTVIVTGSNTGLGRDAARQLANLGASKVIIAVRSLPKGEEAAAAIRESLPDSSTTSLEVWSLDLSSYESIQEFATRASKLDRLDGLLENAGVYKANFTVAEEHESTIMVNVVGTFLLALLLLPKLRATASKFNVVPHVTIVSSEVAFWAKFNERHAPSIFEELKNPKSDMEDRYMVSKLLEALAVREIAKTISAGTKPLVVINYPNPGFCESNLRREHRNIVYIILETLVQRKTEYGARNLVYAINAGEKTHGQYISDCHIAGPPPLCQGEEGALLQQRVWNELAEKLNKVQPGITSNL